MAYLLSLCILISLVPTYSISAVAAEDKLVQISKKSFRLAPGVTEYELVTNDNDLSKQQVGHIMEISPDSSSEIRVGYNDYNIRAIASGSNWAMVRPTEQAQKAETAAQIDVIGVVNGDFFNMANGCPSGYTVMQGMTVRDVNSSCFWIDSAGKAHISANRAEVESICTQENVAVQEAVGGGAILVEDGQRTNAGGNYGDAANPRTVAGIKPDGTVILYMVNGRQAPYSVGMVYGDLADIMLHLGCVDAINLDGGGSSVFATQREGERNNNGTAGLTVRCRPSDGYERSVSTSLMVVSTAASDGVFDHATITPAQEIYTPNSTVQFSAAGIDKAGKPAPLPDGLTWTVASGDGVIDANGLYYGSSNEGVVRIELKNGSAVVGTAIIEQRWPDKLGFTNASISLDFGKSNDLTFNPTYKGQPIHYKDGDFVWGVDESKSLTYKHSAPVEKFTKPGWGGYTTQLSLPLTGVIGSTQVATASYSNYLVYESKYKETSRNIFVDDRGVIQAREEIKHETSTIWSYANGSLVLDNITADVEADTGKGQGGVQGIKEQQTVEFTLGSFKGNIFTSDENNSFNGTLKVSLKDQPGISASIAVIVGMEPVVLMDFEGGHKDPITGNTLPAEDYWTVHVGMSEANGGNSLSLAEREKYRLMVRDTTAKGVVFPTNADGSQINGIVAAEDDPNVRFGSHAFRLAWDFTKVAQSAVGAADFGFSSLIYAHVVQPTKIGFWLNVPESLSNDDSQLKMIFVGGITEVTDTTAADKGKPGFENAYYDMDAEGNLTWHPHKLPKGTTQYLCYYSYDSEGNITGRTLSDWAGKGWTWVEADLSGAQFPIGIQYGYTIRVVSLPNSVKRSGTILIDNLQLIYGTNTNDINNPVIETVSERNTNTTLSPSGVTEITKSAVAFEALYNDSADKDKYASGIDAGSVRISIDGVDFTASAEISESSLLLPAVTLTNGEHNVKVSVKDRYGNETVATRTIRINDDAGTDALVGLRAQEAAPQINRPYQIDIISKTGQPIDTAEVSLKLYETYLDKVAVTPGSGYSANFEKDAQNKLIKISISKTAEDVERNEVLAKVSINIPGEASSNENLVFSIPSGRYEEAGGAATFSVAEQSRPLTAAYIVAAETAIKNYPTVITVKTEGGEPAANVSVYCDGTLLPERTDSNGQLTHTFDAATSSAHVVYAMDDDGGRSWNVNTPVCGWATDGNGEPFGIQNVAVKHAELNATITWMSAIGEGNANGYIRYAEDKTNVSSAENVEAASKVLAFAQANGGEAMYLHTVRLTGLTPDTTYFYQVGDGTKWSDILSFTTASDNKKADTSFAVFGDIQTGDTSRLAAALNAIRETKYDFAMQTGDAIDNVTNFSQWRALFTVLNANTLAVPMVHTLGNHEYYGAANGEISRDIFALPESAQGSYYSVEYGSVYVGVINNGGNIAEALGQMKQDAAASSCEWKVLVTHEPVYGTTDEMSADARKRVTDAIEAAGIEFVFSGDDHSYARTYPMKGGEKLPVESADGVIYYISGDLSSKDNAFNIKDHFAKAIAHNEYDGCYLTVEASANSFTVKAVKYNGELLDSFTRMRSACQQGDHSFTDESQYILATDQITCALCGTPISAATSGYTGVLSTRDGMGRVMISAGSLKKNEWFALGEDICHAGEDGILHETETKDTATCLNNGMLMSTCKTCGETYRGSSTWAKGHTWDANHHCTICDMQGIDIAQAELTTQYRYYSYTGTGIRPASSATYNGKKLVASSDRYGTDAYVSYQNNTEIGIGTVIYEGRGNFYGEASVTFTIVPASVQTITATESGMHSITLGWAAAKGAPTYLIQQKMGEKWYKVGETSATSFTVDRLESQTEYEFRVNTRAVAGGTNYYSLAYSNVLKVKTIGDPSELSETYIIGMDCEVFGQTIRPQSVNARDYLFLPSASDLDALHLRFTVEGTDEKITVSGNAGSIELAGYNQNLNINSLAIPEEDGSYLLKVRLSDLQPVTIYLLQSSHIPAMYLTSTNPAEQGRDYVDEEKGRVATAHMQLVTPDGTARYDGELTQLKARGNSTFKFYPKKSYQIKLATGADLLGNQENTKKWVLLAGYGDATQMHDKLFKDLAAELGLAYTPSCDWVDLYYDGEYRGVYLLSEKNEISASSVSITDMEKAYRDIFEEYGTAVTTDTAENKYGISFLYTKGLPALADITGGYLLELNHNEIDEANGFSTRKGVSFNIKSPEFAGEDAVSYVSEYYQEFEDAVYATDISGNYTGYNEKTGKYYYDYCDINSLVKVYLLQQLSLNSDSFASSLFFYKDAGAKLYAGPIWDMEMTCGTAWEEQLHPSRDFLQLRYLSEALQQIPSFQNAVKKYFQTAFSEKTRDLYGADGRIAAYYEKLADSVSMNSHLWPYVRVGSPTASNHLWREGTTYDDVIDDLMQWMQQRLTVMENMYKTGADSGNTGGGGSTATNTETTTNPDGSVTKTETKPDGTVIETTTGKDGSTTKITTKPDGSSVTESKTANGTTGTVKTDVNGRAEAEAKVSEKAVEDAKKSGEAVKVPTEVKAGESSNSAPTVKVELPKNAGETKIEIPVEDVNSGTVAVIVYLDGTEEIVKDSKPTEDGVQLTVDGSTTIKIIDNSKDFIDTRDHWSRDEVNFVASREIFNGVGGNNFGVDQPMTRGMVNTVLARLAGVDTTPKNGQKWYEVGNEWARANGISDGTNPEASVTREQLATLLYRFSGKPEVSGTLRFADAGAVSAYAQDALLWATQNGILNGVGNNCVAPSADAQRAQVAAMMARYLKSAG